MNRPKPDSQAGRLLALLESRVGQCVSLPEILALRIAQYSARIHDLRHRYGFHIETGCEHGRPDHSWFRLVGRRLPAPDQLEDRAVQAALRSELETGKSAGGLFSAQELERTARWKDEG